MKRSFILTSLFFSYFCCQFTFAAHNMTPKECQQMMQEMGLQPRINVIPANDPTYQKECGSCHFAYPPGLLPVASWQKVMENLADHFGENAELDDDTQQQLTAYVTQHAAEFSPYPLANRLLNSLKNRVPLRITEIPYIANKHWKLPFKLVEENPQVKALSYCNKCHQHAEDGIYNRHDVSIPNYETLHHCDYE